MLSVCSPHLCSTVTSHITHPCPPLCRPFFQYVLAVLPAATMLPLALRFPGRPDLLLAAGALLRCILHPQPWLAMAALWAVSFHFVKWQPAREACKLASCSSSALP